MPTSISRNTQYKGETIERKVRRVTNNKEPIGDGAELIYTERSEGVKGDYDIRTDRFDVAIDAMDRVTKSAIAQRELRNGERTYDTMNEKQQKEFHEKFPTNKHNKREDGKAKPTQGTGEQKA